MGVENEEKNNLNLANKVFNWQNVLILGGLNSGISMYMGNKYNAFINTLSHTHILAWEFMMVYSEVYVTAQLLLHFSIFLS